MRGRIVVYTRGYTRIQNFIYIMINALLSTLRCSMYIRTNARPHFASALQTSATNENTRREPYINFNQLPDFNCKIHEAKIKLVNLIQSRSIKKHAHK